MQGDVREVRSLAYGHNHVRYFAERRDAATAEAIRDLWGTMTAMVLAYPTTTIPNLAQGLLMRLDVPAILVSVVLLIRSASDIQDYTIRAGNRVILGNIHAPPIHERRFVVDCICQS